MMVHMATVKSDVSDNKKHFVLEFNSQFSVLEVEDIQGK